MFVNMARAQKLVERGEATMTLLAATALALFSERGYRDVAAEDIVAKAGVTRGALYHHFDGKRGLFEAVFVDCERQIAERISRAAGRHENATDQLVAGSLAFLDACADVSLRRIVIDDAPSVLGWSIWRRIDGEHGFALLINCIDQLARERKLSGYTPEALAYLLSGAMNELALWVADSMTPRATLKVAKSNLETLLRRIVVH